MKFIKNCALIVLLATVCTVLIFVLFTYISYIYFPSQFFIDAPLKENDKLRKFQQETDAMPDIIELKKSLSKDMWGNNYMVKNIHVVNDEYDICNLVASPGPDSKLLSNYNNVNDFFDVYTGDDIVRLTCFKDGAKCYEDYIFHHDDVWNFTTYLRQNIIILFKNRKYWSTISSDN